jgi:DNA-binding transcriptional LysR family regulator
MDLVIQPELRQLRYFVAVARELNFTRAAEGLHIAQQALSSQVRLLEEQLGVQLLRRSTRHVELTPAGRVLLEEAEELLAAAQRAVRRTQTAGRGEVGTLQLAYAPMAAYGVLPELLAALEEQLPAVLVNAWEAWSSDAVEGVRAHRYQLALTLEDDAGDGLAREVVRRAPLMVVTGASHPLAGHRVLPLSAFAEHTLLLFPRRLAPAYHDRLIAFCREAGFEPQVKETPAPGITATLARLAAGRDELSLVPASLASSDAPGVAWIEVSEPVCTADVSMVWSPADPTPVANRVLAVARAEAGRRSWLGQERTHAQ